MPDSTPSSPVLAGKVAMVTGAARGIGLAIARELLEHGAAVGLTDMDSEALEGAVAEVASRMPAAAERMVALPGSVTSPTDVKAAVATLVRRFGSVDIAVNNAGTITDRPLMEMSDTEWDEVVASNLRGTFLVTREVLSHMLAGGYGRVVNITSTAGLIGSVNRAHYAAAKMGIVGFTRAAALEMAGHPVTVNAVAPFAWSRLTAAMPALQAAPPEQIAAMKRLRPEDVAHLVVYLASPAAGFISGQVFCVRGKELMLFSQPRPVKWAYRADGWSMDQLSQFIPAAMASTFTPLEASASYFGYEPLA